MPVNFVRAMVLILTGIIVPTLAWNLGDYVPFGIHRHLLIIGECFIALGGVTVIVPLLIETAINAVKAIFPPATKEISHVVPRDERGGFTAPKEYEIVP